MTETTAEKRRKTRACCTRHRPRANGDCADCWCLEATAQQRRRKQVETQLSRAREEIKKLEDDKETILKSYKGCVPPIKLRQVEAQSKEVMELLRERSQALHQLHKKPSKFVATWLICMKEPCPSDRAVLLQPQPITEPACERVSVCCGAPEHSDVENFCAQCGEGTGFECNVHEVEWGEGECPKAVRTADNAQQD